MPTDDDLPTTGCRPTPDGGHEIDLFDDLDGHVALVTGANRGIGAAIADGLADLGATVFAGARRADERDWSPPEDREAVRLDVTDATDREQAVERIRATAGRLDVLVNNAGVMDTRESLDEMPAAEIDRVLETNLRGAIHMTKTALPALLADTATRPARVVNLSSGLGQLTSMGDRMPAYRVSKVGLNGFTAYLDADYRADGLIANAVSPGWVRTDMGGPEAARSPADGAATPIWLARFADGPAGRFWKDRSIREW